MQVRLPRRLALLLALASLAAPSMLHAQDHPLLADHGRSDYVIVVAEAAPPAVRHAAEELQHWLAQMTRATLPIVSDQAPLPAHALLVGPSQRSRELGLADAAAKLGPESYLLRTLGERLLILGGEPRGTLYGVYGLCEQHFGCRWFTPEVSRIPVRELLPLPLLDETRTPALEYRDVHIPEGTTIGYDAEADRERYFVTESGITVVTRDYSLFENPVTVDYFTSE